MESCQDISNEVKSPLPCSVAIKREFLVVCVHHLGLQNKQHEKYNDFSNVFYHWSVSFSYLSPNVTFMIRNV